MTALDCLSPFPLPSFVRQASYPWLIVACACFGGFMGQLDASIVQLAMPSLETAFDAPVNAVSWVAVGYMLAVACALPIFARLAEIAGRKTFFLSGFASFAILSTLCGLAPTLASLTGLARLLGVGARDDRREQRRHPRYRRGPGTARQGARHYGGCTSRRLRLGPDAWRPVARNARMAVGLLGQRTPFRRGVRAVMADRAEDRRFRRRQALRLAWRDAPRSRTCDASCRDRSIPRLGAFALAGGLRRRGADPARRLRLAGAGDSLPACRSAAVSLPFLLGRRDWRSALLRDAFRNVLCDVVRFRARLSRSADDRRATPHHHSDCARNRRALRWKRFRSLFAARPRIRSGAVRSFSARVDASPVGDAETACQW